MFTLISSLKDLNLKKKNRRSFFLKLLKDTVFYWEIWFLKVVLKKLNVYKDPNPLKPIFEEEKFLYFFPCKTVNQQTIAKKLLKI